MLASRFRQLASRCRGTHAGFWGSTVDCGLSTIARNELYRSYPCSSSGQHLGNTLMRPTCTRSVSTKADTSGRSFWQQELGSPLQVGHAIMFGLGASLGLLYANNTQQGSFLREAGVGSPQVAQVALPGFSSFQSIPEAVPTKPPAGYDSANGENHNSDPAATKVLTADFLSQAAAKAAPSVVNITLTPGGFQRYLGRASGSGFIIDPDGTIVTNAHVVSPSGNGRGATITVTLQDGRTFPASVKSVDTMADLAVVKVDSKEPLPAATLGTSSTLQVGQWVLALGSPLHLQNSVTSGIISCVDRKSSDLGLRGRGSEYIQTDAAINQGNSGGPLVDLEGRVVGVSNMKALGADNISFAIPIDVVKTVVRILERDGKVVRPYVGIKMLELTPQILEQLHQSDPSFPAVAGGVLVPQVAKGSPADRAGLLPGDVVVAFGGKRVFTAKDVIDTLGYEAGHTYEVEVVRAGGTRAVLSLRSEEAKSRYAP